MGPEKEDGNVEYKLKLINKDNERIERLASQMKFRCNEGGGECIYVIGVEDNGTLVGLNKEEFNETFCNLKAASEVNNFSINVLSKKLFIGDRHVYELLVREINEQSYIDIKINIGGSVDSGKSTFLSVLTRGVNDDGRGSARISIFNFKHEITSGRTSSIAQHILGFDDKGGITNYNCSARNSNFLKIGWPEIVKNSSKIISMFDMPGHEKYLKTTIRGLSSTNPDACIILIGANMGLSKMSREHIFLCVSLNIPFVIVITKIDLNRENILKETMTSINRLLKLPGLRRLPYKVENKDDVIISAKNIHACDIVPIFHISNVTGDGMDNIKHFLNILPKNKLHTTTHTQEVELHVDTIFNVHGIGTVVGGQLLSGNIKNGDKLLIGPSYNGHYETIIVRSIHCKRVPKDSVKSGSYVCLGLKRTEKTKIRRGSVIISTKNEKLAIHEFNADIMILRTHSTTIKIGYSPIINTHTIRQTATLIDIKNIVSTAKDSYNNKENKILRSGDKASVTFKFQYRPEYIKKGDRLVMSEGKLRLIGIVT